MNTAVVIPNWNGMPFVLDCLAALKKQTHKHDVIVVDNGSVDDSIQSIRKHYPKVRIIEYDHNTGFTGGVNGGMQYALQNGYEYVSLLNNDAAPQPTWLEHLATTMQSNALYGIVTCKLLHTDGIHFDSTGDFYTTRGMAFPRGRNTKDTGQYNKLESVFSATGGASLYRCAMLQQIGIFDDYFFAYFEDVDISFRARLAGWDVIYQPKSVCYHAISATSSRVSWFGRYHSVKNIPILYLKNMPALLFWKYLPIFTYQLLRQFVASVVKGYGWIHIKALCKMTLHIPSALLARRTIQKNRKVTAKQIDDLLVHSKPPVIPSV